MGKPPVKILNCAFGMISAKGTAWIAWPHFDFFFVHQGAVRVRIKGAADCVLEAPDGIVLAPHTRFRLRARGAAAKASIQHFKILGGDSFEDPLWKFLSDCEGTFRCAGRQKGRQLDELVRYSVELASTDRSLAGYWHYFHHLSAALGRIHEDDLKKDDLAEAPTFEDLKAWLDRHPCSFRTVAHLAQALGCSPSKVKQWFRATLGESAGSYLRELRLREAKRLVVETELPLKVVSDLTGYARTESFYAAFRKSARATPGKYRRRMRTISKYF